MKNGEFSLFKDKHGFVIGGLEDVPYREYELSLEPGDKIFVYTDGLPEATDPTGKMFGKDQILHALNEVAAASPQGILNHVAEAVDEFVKDAEQFDDLRCSAWSTKAPRAPKRKKAIPPAELHKTESDNTAPLLRSSRQGRKTYRYD